MQMRARRARTYGLLLLTAFVAALLVAGCSSTRTTGEQIDDAWINTKIKAKLTGDSEINPFNIDVDVLNGVVTLTGKVAKPDTKEQAGRFARQTKGVKQVINEIEVEEGVADTD